MDEASGRGTPRWFWIVAVLAVLWEAFGAYIYLAQTMTPAADRGSDYAAMANWQWAVFATAVWSGVLGAVALLLRSRFATLLLLVSFLAATFQYGSAAIAGTLSADARPVAITIMVIGLVLVMVSSRARRAGWLR